MKNIYTCLTVIIGAFVGAGFASGREILDFFVRYGKRGYLGIVVSCVLLGGITGYLLDLVTKNKEIIEKSFGKNQLMNRMMQFFWIGCFCVMVSAISVFVSQEFHIPLWYGSAIGASLCYLMLIYKMQAMQSICKILVPGILLCMIFLGIKSISSFNGIVEESLFETKLKQCLTSAFLYAGYNVLVIIFLIDKEDCFQLGTKQIVVVSIGVTLIMMTLMLCVFDSNYASYSIVKNVELPNLILAKAISDKFEIIYAIIILGAILTTAFSCGYAFLLSKPEKHFERNAMALCLGAFLFSRIGFSRLLKGLFPVYGLWGIVLIARIIMKNRRV